MICAHIARVVMRARARALAAEIMRTEQRIDKRSLCTPCMRSGNVKRLRRHPTIRPLKTKDLDEGFARRELVLRARRRGLGNQPRCHLVDVQRRLRSRCSTPAPPACPRTTRSRRAERRVDLSKIRMRIGLGTAGFISVRWRTYKTDLRGSFPSVIGRPRIRRCYKKRERCPLSTHYGRCALSEPEGLKSGTTPASITPS